MSETGRGFSDEYVHVKFHLNNMQSNLKTDALLHASKIYLIVFKF
jgi:hypothetical protein